MADDQAPAEDQETPPEASGTGRFARLAPLLVLLGCALLGTVLGAVALPSVLARFESPARPGERAPRPEQPKGTSLEPLEVMVNLADERGRRMLKATIVFRAKDEEAKKEFAAHLTEIRHLLISLLSEKRLEDVEGKEHKDQLLRELRLSVNECLGLPDAVLHAYFTEFMIQ
ncbi:MAG: flagellar basal body-associated protein FliL [Candidatus Brocadiia bacterium]